MCSLMLDYFLERLTFYIQKFRKWCVLGEIAALLFFRIDCHKFRYRFFSFPFSFNSRLRCVHYLMDWHFIFRKWHAQLLGKKRFFFRIYCQKCIILSSSPFCLYQIWLMYMTFYPLIKLISKLNMNRLHVWQENPAPLKGKPSQGTHTTDYNWPLKILKVKSN